jgi:hypothetical protein
VDPSQKHVSNFFEMYSAISFRKTKLHILLSLVETPFCVLSTAVPPLIDYKTSGKKKKINFLSCSTECRKPRVSISCRFHFDWFINGGDFMWTACLYIYVSNSGDAFLCNYYSSYTLVDCESLSQLLM